MEQKTYTNTKKYILDRENLFQIKKSNSFLVLVWDLFNRKISLKKNNRDLVCH